jgi:hypothetical protein
MKALKVMAIFLFLCGIISFFLPFFRPWPGAPNLYNRFLTSTGMFIIALGLGWPELFKAFSRSLPLAFRLLLAGFLALIVFMDIKTSGFTGYTISNLGWIAAWGWFLFSGK